MARGKISTAALLALGLLARFAAGSPSGRAGPDEPAGRDRAVQDAEARWVAALDHRDAAALESLLDDAFVDVTWKGQVRDKRAAVAAGADASRPPMEQSLQDLRVRFAAADVAIVTGVNAVAGKDPGFSARIRFTDVFVRRAGAWKALSAQETLEQGSR